MKQKLFSVGLLLFFCLTVGLFFYKSVTIIDPDFGWHLTTGKYILSHGIPTHDIYSYTMPSYPWIDHEWLADIIIYEIYSLTGIWGLAFTFTFLAVATCLILYKTLSREEHKYSVPFFVLTATVFVLFGGIRLQIISWLFFAVTLMVLHKKQWIWVPVLFLFWANLHGGFVGGLLYTAVYSLMQSIRLKKFQWQIYLTFCISIIATIINPYTWHIYKEIWSSLSDITLRSSIAEWFPAYRSLDEFIFWIGAGIAFPILWIFRKKVVYELPFFIIITISAISSVRNIPLWCVYVTFLLPQILHQGFQKIKPMLITKAINVLTGIIIIFSLEQIAVSFADIRAVQRASYPVKTIDYLKSHPTTGNIFALYNWGGYLIWKMPGTKVFIDGRMPSWRNNSAPTSESQYAFGDYKKFLADKQFAAKQIAKYNITTLVLPKIVKQQRSIVDTWIGVEDVSDIRTFASGLGFKKVYSGKITEVFVRE